MNFLTTYPFYITESKKKSITKTKYLVEVWESIVEEYISFPLLVQREGNVTCAVSCYGIDKLILQSNLALFTRIVWTVLNYFLVDLQWNKSID